MSAAPGTEVAQRTPQQELVARVAGEQFQQQVALALPEQVAPRRFIRATITALNQNPDLADPQKCDVNTVFTALLRAAQDGLLPDGREAAIAIYKGKAQYLPMIGGYRKIAGDHGWQIVARVVYSNDVFEYEQGTDPKVRHVPVRPGADRGERIAAYATARHIGGAVAAPIVMYTDEVEARKKIAQTDRVWAAWTDRMWEKTVGKALFKELPIGELDPRFARVIAAEDVPSDQARALLYGSNGDTPALTPPADGQAGGTTAAPDQQAEAVAASSSGTAAASAPDSYPDEPTSAFVPPEGAVSPETLAAQQAADAAGSYTVDRGRNGIKDHTIAQIGDQPKGDEWLFWILAGKRDGSGDVPLDHPARPYAEAFVRFYKPELWQEAQAALQLRSGS